MNNISAGTLARIEQEYLTEPLQKQYAEARGAAENVSLQSLLINRRVYSQMAASAISNLQAIEEELSARMPKAGEDATEYIQGFLSAGESVYLPPGEFRIPSSITL